MAGWGRVMAAIALSAIAGTMAGCGGTGATAPAADAPGSASTTATTTTTTTTTATGPSQPPGSAPTPAPSAPPSASASVASAAAQPVALPPAGYHLAWSDEFDGAALDASRWSAIAPGQPDHGGDVSDPATISVANGLLTNTIFTDSAGTHHVGLLWTSGQYSFQYGYVEASIRFEGASGAWCGFWIQTPTMGLVQDNTAVSGTEIDVLEHRAYDQSNRYIGDTGALNLNWNAYASSQRANVGKQVSPPNGIPLQGNWHTYGVLWTASKYTWFIDHYPVWESTVALSQRTEFLILTCQVSNGSWAGNVPPGGYGTLQTSTARMQVDWVRVWQQ